MRARMRPVSELAALLAIAGLLAGASAAQTAPQPKTPAQAGAGAVPGSAATFEALRTRADAARDAEKLDDASRLYRRALAIRPSWAEGWWSLGTIDFDSSRYAESEEDFRRLLKLAPNDGSTYMMLGLSEYELRDYDDSSKHLALAWKLGIRDAEDMEPVLLYHRVLLALRARHFEAATQLLQQMTHKGIRNREVEFAYGMSAMRVTPDEVPPVQSEGFRTIYRIGHAEASDSTDTHQQARDLYEAAVNAAPDFPNIHFAYGRFLMEINEPDAAAEQFKLELKNNPKDYQSMLKLASLDYRVDSAAGIPYAEEALKLAPNYPLGHYLLGVLCLDTGDVDRAIKELETARKMMPAEPQIAFSLASAYTKAHRKEDAAAEKAEFMKLQSAQSDNDTQRYYDEKPNTGVELGSQESDTVAKPENAH
ncbi:MAG: tetratricopeptide repeat protein [Terracidiphilus sp.]